MARSPRQPSGVPVRASAGNPLCLRYQSKAFDNTAAVCSNSRTQHPGSKHRLRARSVPGFVFVIHFDMFPARAYPTHSTPTHPNPRQDRFTTPKVCAEPTLQYRLTKASWSQALDVPRSSHGTENNYIETLARHFGIVSHLDYVKLVTASTAVSLWYVPEVFPYSRSTSGPATPDAKPSRSVTIAATRLPSQVLPQQAGRDIYDTRTALPRAYGMIYVSGIRLETGRPCQQ